MRLVPEFQWNLRLEFVIQDVHSWVFSRGLIDYTLLGAKRKETERGGARGARQPRRQWEGPMQPLNEKRRIRVYVLLGGYIFRGHAALH